MGGKRRGSICLGLRPPPRFFGGGGKPDLDPSSQEVGKTSALPTHLPVAGAADQRRLRAHGAAPSRSPPPLSWHCGSLGRGALRVRRSAAATGVKRGAGEHEPRGSYPPTEIGNERRREGGGEKGTGEAPQTMTSQGWAEGWD